MKLEAAVRTQRTLRLSYTSQQYIQVEALDCNLCKCILQHFATPKYTFFYTYVTLKLATAVPPYNTSQLVQLQASVSLLSKNM